ncbi:MAG: M10 family metallopeptidase C-terminal domain-containing protein [Pirellulaceae bacterium]|nr:M10 family metallopeptidase C-terminal domain-containing protein [Pirellulaceae bacterium]MDG2102976.1 M10 family metallopeptidase C-terminal domain-containing protein [Pirellulaceae bacterium]
MAAPNVFFDNFAILLGSTELSAEVFFGNDPDGDTIERYELTDLNGNSGSVKAIVNGIVKPANTPFEVADLSTMIFNGGTTIEKNAFRVRAFAGGEWGPSVDGFFFGVVQENQKPVVVASDLSVVQSEMLSLSDYISAVDPDGFPIKRYRILDANDGPTSGHIELDGVELAPQQWHFMWPDELARAKFVAAEAAPNNDPIYIRAFDRFNGNGVQQAGQWSVAVNVNSFTTANINRPMGIPIEYDMATEESIALSDLMAFTDADNNTLKRFRFYDTAVHPWSGNVEQNGVALDAGQWYEFSTAELGELTWKSADRSFTEQIRFQFFDGNNWSDVSTSRVRTNEKPMIGVAEEYSIKQQLEFVDVSDLVVKLDDGPVFTKYEIYDANTDVGSSNFRLGATTLQPGVIHEITPSEFFDLQIKTGVYEQRSLDDMYVRAYNGTFWSDFTRHTVRTEPEYIDSLDQLGSWQNYRPTTNGMLNMTFSYMQTFPAYGGGPEEEFISPWPEMRALTRQSFDRMEELVNVQWEEVADSESTEFGRGGDVRIGTYCEADNGVAAYAYAPGPGEINGDMWFNRWYTGNSQQYFTDASDPPCGFPSTDDPPVIPPGFFIPSDAWDKGSPNYAVFNHEFGHANGMSHPFDGDPVLPAVTDNANFSVMSYTGAQFSEWGQQLYDIAVLQTKYGANMTHATGDNVYDSDYWRGTLDVVDSIWDAGGTDTIDASDQFIGASFDLRPGGFNLIGQGVVSIAFGVDIENAIGTQFDDKFVGNELANVLEGTAGNDVFEGYGGNDLLKGGANNDTYIYKNDDGMDVINEDFGGGRDNIDIGLFLGMDDFSEDLSFTRQGFDMEINFTIDQGISRGSITVENQGFGRNRVETLDVLGVPVDLRFLFESITEPSQRFAITGTMGQYGFEVTPV